MCLNYCSIIIIKKGREKDDYEPNNALLNVLGKQIQQVNSITMDRLTKKVQNDLNQNTLLSRNIPEHPTNPMANQDIEIFQINKATHMGCSLPENMYHVKKSLDPPVNS